MDGIAKLVLLVHIDDAMGRQLNEISSIGSLDGTPYEEGRAMVSVLANVVSAHSTSQCYHPM